jgi:hypothetical protein
MVMLFLSRYKSFNNGINDEVILGPIVPYLTNYIICDNFVVVSLLKCKIQQTLGEVISLGIFKALKIYLD